MNLQPAVAIALTDDLWLAGSASGALIGDVCFPRPVICATADARGPGDDDDDDDEDDDRSDRDVGNIDPDDDEGYDDEEDDDDEEPLQVKPK